MVVKPEFFQKDITTWLEECEVRVGGGGGGCPPGRVRGHAAGVQQMLNRNIVDNDEWKWELVDSENKEKNHGNIVELKDHPFAEIEGLRPVMRLP